MKLSLQHAEAFAGDVEEQTEVQFTDASCCRLIKLVGDVVVGVTTIHKPRLQMSKHDFERNMTSVSLIAFSLGAIFVFHAFRPIK
jgi:hypothetical protein